MRDGLAAIDSFDTRPRQPVRPGISWVPAIGCMWTSSPFSPIAQPCFSSLRIVSLP